MHPADIDLLAMLKRVRLPTVANVLPRFIERAAAESWSHRDFLAAIIAEEVAHRETTRIQRAASLARFPYLKTIEEFDFIFQSSLKRSQLGPFLDPDFVTNGRHLILEGRPGLGKTHLAIAIAYKAIQHGHNALFIPATNLIDDLAAAAKEGRLREATAAYLDPAVLIIDEVGYLQHADNAANVLYGVIDGRCHRKKPLIFTTNKPLREWGEVLHDRHLAEAILDRILEHGSHIELAGRSWRTRNHDGDLVASTSAP
jgi:DNA replication protein DnaC